ncbi:MAG: hypothetical protein OEZ06_28370 [Myxococcales bacterium]|nr:hypothetical protein [Myxococcales bacterium]
MRESIQTRRHLGAVYTITFFAAGCSLLYELLLAQTLSALLGNTVVRYSITIGCYLGALGLGAMLCERGADRLVFRLARIEVLLSLVGGLSVPLLYTLDMIHNWLYAAATPLADGPWPGWLFLGMSHLLIVAIGVLSGFEIPLLLALGEEMKPGCTNRVLGFDYIGSLAASVLFPLWLLRSLGLLAAGLAVGLVNAALLLSLLVIFRERLGKAFRIQAVVAIAVLTLVSVRARGLEQHFLHKLYFDAPDTSFFELFRPSEHDGHVERIRSPYQRIDLVSSEVDDQWLYDLLSAKRNDDPDYPVDTWLYLDRAYQVFSGNDEFYHEWFVHAPVQASGRAPRRLLVIGGGDGLAVRAALEYPSVQEVVHVELDREMVRLSREHPALLAMNQRVHDDPRVKLVISDGFQWLRSERSRFDGIYVDLPYAKDYNLSLLYSREFYATARRRLVPGGFLAMDAPGLCDDGELWDVYYSTLRAAGFATVRPFITSFSAEAPRLEQQLRRKLRSRPGAGEVDLEPLLQELEWSLAELPIQEFLLAFPEERRPNLDYRDFGVETDAFDAFHHARAFEDRCTRAPRYAESRVNSIARPSLPPL